jgi:hypothetical protein
VCLAHPALAQTVESLYSVTLTGKLTQAGPRGDRTVRVRISTKDLIRGFTGALGITPGRSHRLVVRREIADLGFEDAREFLVVDDDEYPVGGTAEVIEMPRSFHGQSGSSARRPGWPESRFTQEGVGMFRMGSGALGQSELVFSALARRRARLLTQQGIPVGYVHSTLTWTVDGVLVDEDGTAMPLSGRLALGREKVVE